MRCSVFPCALLMVTARAGRPLPITARAGRTGKGAAGSCSGGGQTWTGRFCSEGDMLNLGARVHLASKRAADHLAVQREAPQTL